MGTTYAASLPVVCNPNTRWRSEPHKGDKFLKKVSQAPATTGTPRAGKSKVGKDSLRSKSNAPSRSATPCPQCMSAPTLLPSQSEDRRGNSVITHVHSVASSHLSNTLDRSAIWTESSKENPSANSGLGGVGGKAKMLPREVEWSKLPQLLL